MSDHHLNLFYSYNQDNELIENNFTRAWIVTLRMLSAETRNLFLQILLKEHFQFLGEDMPSFGSAHFALQGHIDKHRLEKISQKYILTIATQRELEMSKADSENMDNADSIPDAWIYDIDQGYCFLLEAKVGNNPLNPGQVYRHAEKWLGIGRKEIKAHLFSLTWVDLLKAINDPGLVVSNPQEHLLIKEFASFVGFQGYRIFDGFEFDQLLPAPAFFLTTLNNPRISILDFRKLKDAPAFRIGITPARTIFE